MNRRTLEGIEVNEDTLGLETIAKVGPGGDFLGTKHTKTYLRKLQWKPTIFNRITQQAWEEQGSQDLREKARRKALDILANHVPQPLPAGIKATMDSLVEAHVKAGK